MRERSITRCLAVALCALLVGCQNTSTGPAPSPAEIAELREKLILAEEPSGAIGVVELRQQLTGDGGAEAPVTAGPQAVVLMGRVHGPFDKEFASFLLIDPTATEHHTHEHEDGEECPFCAKQEAEAQAVVQFADVDASQAIDAPTLFNLQESDLVVVHGTAEAVGSLLFVHADGIHVRR
ncbi:MAG: hypothetical protein KDA60_03480 [Planctomycetales bacterium]|nr:hypothetical protein [Planctomycetales bacterium]